MANIKYKDATPVDEPVARPKQKAKPAPPKPAPKSSSPYTNSVPVDEPVAYAKGGSASSRGDGIAQRGKTRGMMVMCGGGMAKGKK
jgi:hypothetical protein